MSDEITIEQQLAAVRREIAMRKNVYPKWVTTGRMKLEKADAEIAAMQAVHDTLETGRAGWIEITAAAVPKDGRLYRVKSADDRGFAWWSPGDDSYGWVAESASLTPASITHWAEFAEPNRG